MESWNICPTNDMHVIIKRNEMCIQLKSKVNTLKLAIRMYLFVCISVKQACVIVMCARVWLTKGEENEHAPLRNTLPTCGYICKQEEKIRKRDNILAFYRLK